MAPALLPAAFSLGLLLAALSPFVEPAAAASGSQWRACLSCHDDDALTLTTVKGERLSLAVAAAELEGSAHRKIECRGCHPGVKLESHPGTRRVSGLEEYRIAASRSCLTCHPASGLRALSQHAAVVFEEQQLRCVGCHGFHGIKKIAVWKQGLAADEYCLTCHTRTLRILRPDGTALSLAVDEAQLRASVHPDHECADCHDGFSKSAHPAEAIGDRASRSLAATNACANCHDDKLREVEGSIHFKLLRSGADGAPGCTNCHSAHAVAPAERLATLTGTPCRACHARIFEAYSESMHGVALGSGEHFTAPMCSDCHRAHDVHGSAQPAQVRAACIGCHKSAVRKHADWLPNAALHLDAVSCPACHAPKAQRVVTLRLVEEGTGRQLGVNEVQDLLGTTVAAAFDPESKGISGLSLWSAMRRLESLRQSSAAKLRIVGRLEVARGLEAHRLAVGSSAERVCESCHQSDSPAFDQVALTLVSDDGRPKRFDGAPGMLTDAASVLSVHDFYALGATRHWVLDWLLLLAVAGGLSVVGVHLTMRLWSARSGKGRE